MARGRMISNAIAQDKRINQLMDDTSRLAYTWLITFADCEGRTPGDPAVVRSMLFPRREDITIVQMEGCIRQWADCGLIIWYEAKGDMWIYFPAFFNHNTINRDREAASKIPPPPPNLLANNSGVTPDQLSVKLNKVKLNQDNTSESKPLDDSFSVNYSIIEKDANEELPNIPLRYSSALQQSWAEWKKQEVIARGRGKPELVDKYIPPPDADWKTIDEKTYHLRFELRKVC